METALIKYNKIMNSRKGDEKMSFSDFVKGQFIDVIDYVDESGKLLVYKHDRYHDEIKQGATLIVREGQAAAFIHNGRLADIFYPGDYTLNTDNLPVLSSLNAFKNLFYSPIKSDLYFLNTTQFINNKWGTKNPIIMPDPRMRMVRVRAFGTYAFRISDVETFLKEVLGARKLTMTYEIIEFLNSFVAESVAMALGERNIEVIKLATEYRQLASSIIGYVNEKANKLGLEIVELAIENISLPEDVEKLIDEQSGIGLAAEDMDTFVQYQTVRAMRDASKQKGGLAGLGAGMAFGKKIANTVDTGTASKEKSDVDKIREYKQLVEEGLITEEEFAVIKKKILGI